ncbi:1074_t:CDS:1, partial [Dentiscutata heterogama]
ELFSGGICIRSVVDVGATMGWVLIAMGWLSVLGCELLSVGSVSGASAKLWT